MSKAFVREDDGIDEPVMRRPYSPVAAGEKNYVTPAGAHRLREALVELKRERVALTAAPVKPDMRGELQEIDQRLHYLEESLRTAEIVPAPEGPWDTVRFGATVDVRDSKGNEARYRIVGVDEADASRDCVSWRAPIARALLQAKLGQRVSFQFPKGKTELEIVAIKYD